jgi:hypothetical protein
MTNSTPEKRLEMRRKFRIDFYKGTVSPENFVKKTTVYAMDEVHARQFAKMRATKHGWISEVTPAE